MTPPLYFDSPGVTFDSGLSWDSSGSTPSKKMPNTKAILDFSGYPGGDLVPLAHTIHDAMTTNAATFPNPPVMMANLATLITDYEQKLAAKTSRATTDIHAANDARDALETALSSLAGYVNSVAKGDGTIVDLSGIPSYVTGHAVDTTAPPPPASLTLRQGDVSGSVVARYQPGRSPSMNEVQTCTGDPSVDANWHTVGMFSGGKAELTGIAPKTDLYVRVRTCGLKGAMGNWSDLAKITVL
jgi:hypothetical protein